MDNQSYKCKFCGHDEFYGRTWQTWQVIYNGFGKIDGQEFDELVQEPKLLRCCKCGTKVKLSTILKYSREEEQNE